MWNRAPLGMIGALGGAVGALPLVSAARGLAFRLAAPPELPGAEKVAGDLKIASFAEAAALLVALPIAALFFGALLPRWLEARAPAGETSFEWISWGFAIAFPIWRGGASARLSLSAGAAVAFLAAASLLLARRGPWLGTRLRDLAGEPIGRLLATAGAWELARRSSIGGSAPEFAALSLAAVVAAVPFFLLPLADGVRSRA